MPWPVMRNWFRPELRILFACTANVCRSPLAEAMLRQRLRVLGLGRRVRVSSAGTRVGQAGRRPDPRVQKLAAENGVPLGQIRASQLTPAMIQASHYILVMDQGHVLDIAELLAVPELPGTVQLLGAYLPGDLDRDIEIQDPYYGDWQGFCEVFDRIDLALDGLVRDVQERLAVVTPEPEPEPE